MQTTFSKSWLLHPIAIFTAVWGGVYLLYSLHLSRVLLYDNNQAFETLLTIWLPFVVTCVLYSLLRRTVLTAAPVVEKPANESLDRLEKRLKLLFRGWVAITAVETVLSGGLPILWLLTGNPKNYADFGISGIHGFANSLIMSIALCRVLLFLKTRVWRHLLVPAFFTLWPFIIVSRILLVVSLIEYLVVYVALNSIRLNTVLKVLGGTLAFVFIFGVVGDLRSGAETFRQLAQPTDHYPNWLPSGVLWVYIYITTPLNNLIHTGLSVRPLNNALFPNTAISLFPRFLRTTIYGYDPSQALSGDLVLEAFNVSTAYVGPVQDYGQRGIVVFSVLIGFFSQMFYHQNRIRGVLVYAILAQCLATSLFFNHFFALPIITQIFWIFVIFAPRFRLY